MQLRLACLAAWAAWAAWTSKKSIKLAHEQISLRRRAARVALWISKKSIKHYFKENLRLWPEVLLCLKPQKSSLIGEY
jgi:Fe-S cluster biosynthesis and repair protein YggX